MASAFTHAFAAGVVACWYRPPGTVWRVVGVAALCAVLPDIDVLGFAMGIQYGDLLGHRGLTHSLLFAVGVGILATRLVYADLQPLTRAWWLSVGFFFIATASHGVLDAMTDGGLGVAFLSPIDPARYFLPWRPLRVPPIGVELFFSRWGIQVMASELLWIWLPGVLVGGVGLLVNQKFGRA